MKINDSHPPSQRPGKRTLPYKCVFFDLDYTLWDYECNSRETLFELHEAHQLLEKGIPFDDFHQRFRKVNFELWQLYDRGLIDNSVIRDERFARVLAHFRVRDEKLAADLSCEYLCDCPKKTNLVPYAKDVLEYLSGQYALTIVTNGFDEIQSVKLIAGKITHYFDHVITSQKAGSKKPDREIFDYALSVNNLRCHEAVMIGDNLLTDIAGARNASIDTIFYNPEALAHSEKVNHEIRCLSELQNIL